VTKLALSNISDFVGRELGVSGWMTVDQSRINQFAKCTGDHQWIHVLADRQAVSRSADQHFCYHIRRPGYWWLAAAAASYRPSTLVRLAARSSDISRLTLRRVMGWCGCSSVRPSARQYVPKADIGGNVSGRNHGTWQTLGDLEARDTAPLH